MKRRTWLCCIIMVFFTLYSAAQDTQIDSLINVLASSVNNPEKVNTLIDLSKQFYGSAHSKAISYGIEAQMLAEEINYQEGLGYALKSIGMGYYLQGNFIEALYYWQQSLEAFRGIDHKNGVANMLNNLGAVNFSQGNDMKATEYYLESLKVAEEIGDTLRILTALVNIGSVYSNKEATIDKALVYYGQALPLSETIGDQNGIGHSAVNMGEIFLKKGDNKSALRFFEKALEAYKKEEQGNVPYALLNIGKVYTARGDYNQAIKYQQQAFELAESRNTKLEMFQSLLALANTYKEMGDYLSAVNTYKQAQSIGEEIEADKDLMPTYEGMADSYAQLADFKNAYQYRLLYSQFRDTLYDAEMDKQIQRLTLSHDLEKKEGEVMLLTKDKELQEINIQKQKIAKNAFMAGTILIFIIAFIIFRNYRQKVKTNKILDQQNAEIEGLILNILPKKVAHELQKNGSATPRYYDSASILFTDFKGFSSISQGLSPNELVDELNTFFMAFDEIVETYNLEKIKTIGDAYMCAGGIPTENETHAIDAVRAGLAMQEYMNKTNKKRIANGLTLWGLRVGIHTGPIVAGVVGKKKYAYDIWGSAVNISSRMESNGETGKLNISAATYELIKDKYVCQYRGKIYAKNIGDIDMYFVEKEIDGLSQELDMEATGIEKETAH